jgi:hypothetical protein
MPQTGRPFIGHPETRKVGLSDHEVQVASCSRRLAYAALGPLIR